MGDYFIKLQPITSLGNGFFFSFLFFGGGGLYHSYKGVKGKRKGSSPKPFIRGFFFFFSSFFFFWGGGGGKGSGFCFDTFTNLTLEKLWVGGPGGNSPIQI
jgi:hypothetical protein